jgi:Uma2 family endonuclease
MPRPGGDVPATTPALLTAEEFARLPGADGPAELVRGEVRWMSPAFWEHGMIAGNVFLLLSAHVRPRRLGACFPDNVGFRLPIPGDVADSVRSPDAAFVRAERIPAEGLPSGWFPFAPDIALEVLSASDTASELQEKLDDYLAAGTALVWVVDPARRAVAVYSPDAPTRRLREGDTLDGAPVLPDFRCAVADLFAGLAPAPSLRSGQAPRPGRVVEGG